MKQRASYVPIVIILIECAVVFRLGHMLYGKLRIKTLGLATIVPFKKQYYDVVLSGEYAGFYEPKPSTSETIAESWLPSPATITINSDSLNEDRDYDITKPSNVYRIIALGDSYTYGQYVSTAKTWPNRMEQLLHDTCSSDHAFEVINLGVGGYDVQYISHRYEIRGAKYTPDLIIWYESGSGFSRMTKLLNSYVKKYDNMLSPQEVEEYRKKGIFYPSYDRANREITMTYGNAYIRTVIGSWWRDFFRMRGNIPVVVTASTTPENRALLRQWTKNQPGVYVNEDMPDLYAMGATLADSHPSEYGHELLARATYAYLKDKGIITCHK